jgi:hypothetical protein
MKGTVFMLNRAGKIAISLVVAGASLVVSTRASADLVATSIGALDRSCVHEVPNGAKVDAEKGNVTLNGKVLAHYEPCTVAPTTVNIPQIRPRGGGQPPATGGGWYESTTGFATTVSSYKGFDELDVSFTVPTPPQTPGTNIFFFFPGLENLVSTGDWISIIQPILGWNNGGSISGWYYEAMEVINNGENGGTAGTFTVYHSPPVHSPYLSSGDLLHTYTWMLASNEWEIYVYDNNTGGYSYNTWYPNSGWSNYTWAQLGVLEGYGQPAETSGISSCSVLPGSEDITFSLDGIWEGGPYWNSWNDAASAVTWSDNDNPNSLAPTTCGWLAQSTGSPVDTTDLMWTF